MKIRLKRLDSDLKLPEQAYDGDAGIDLFSAVEAELAPGERYLIPTGIAIAIPEGYAGFVQPRSGLAIKHGISLVNTPGLIDSSYRGEIKAIIINTDSKVKFKIKRGDKIAQLVLQKIEKIQFEEVSDLDETVRGENGFGSSGI